jgi:hypothetical protein
VTAAIRTHGTFSPTPEPSSAGQSVPFRLRRHSDNGSRVAEDDEVNDEDDDEAGGGTHAVLPDRGPRAN